MVFAKELIFLSFFLSSEAKKSPNFQASGKRAALQRPLPGPPRLTPGGDGLPFPASAISNSLDVCVKICLMSASQMDSNILRTGTRSLTAPSGFPQPLVQSLEMNAER